MAPSLGLGEGAPLVRRELRHRPGRAALLALTVAVAVSFTTAAFGFARQLSLQLDPQDAALGSLALPEGTIVVTPRTTGVTTATSIDDELLDAIRGQPGVLAANGIYDQPVSFAVSAREQPERPVQLRGLVLSSTWDPTRWQLVEGQAPEAFDEVAVDAGGAVVGRAPLGSVETLQLPTGSLDVRVVGLVAPAVPTGSVTSPSTGDGPTAAGAPSDDLPRDGPDDEPFGSPLSVAAIAVASAHVVLPSEHAPALLGATGKVDRVSVVAESGTAPADLASRLRSELPDGVSVITITDRAQDTQHTVEGLDSGLRTAVTAFAGLTVLVAALAIANVHTVIVAQRTRELGLLRLVGARRAQLVRIVLGEAVVIGAIGAAVGLAAGSVLAWIAVGLVRPVGVDAQLDVTPAMALAALAVGVGVTLAGALLPALRAARAAPLDAISDTRGGAERPSRWWVGTALAVGGLGTVTAVVGSSDSLGPSELAILGPGLVVGLAGLALLSRWVVVPFSSAVAAPAAALGGVTARLGLGNVRRRPSRTAAAASTLMVALALVGVVGTIGASARAAIDEQFSNTGTADLYLERRGLVRVDTASLGRSLSERVDGVSDVAEVIAVEGILEGPGGVERTVVTSGLARVDRMMDLDVGEGDPGAGQPAEGSPAGEGAPDAVMLSEDTAARLEVGVGDPLTLRSTSGRQTDVTVVATYRNTGFVGPAVVAREAVADVDAEGTFELAAMRVADSASERRVGYRTQRVVDQFPKVRVHTPEEFAALNRSVADTVLRVIAVLLAGSVGIGFLGLGSTLALSTLERRRELVMLRAVGARRDQIRSLVGVEAAAVGAIAALCGLGAGTAIGWAASRAAPSDLVGPAVIPWTMLAVVGVAAVAMSWAVSLAVARRASTVAPAEAGRSE